MPFAVHKVKSMGEKQVSQEAEICQSKAVTLLFVLFCVKTKVFFEKELRVTVQDSMTFLSTEEVKINLQQ